MIVTARSARDPSEALDRIGALAALTAEIVSCRRCERLVSWREQVATVRRASFAHEEYWGRPVPGLILSLPLRVVNVVRKFVDSRRRC